MVEALSFVRCKNLDRPSTYHWTLRNMATPSKNLDQFPKSFGKVFWNNQFRTTIELPTRQRYGGLESKIAIVTGASTGLGFESAKQLLALGLSRIVLGVRSLAKGKAAAMELAKVSAEATIDVWELEMESYESVRAFAKRCDKELSRLDFVVLNAGLGPLEFAKSPSTGHERTIQVNHLSTALLSILLLPVLKEKSGSDEPGVLTIVNSATAHLCKFPNRDRRPLLPSFDDTAITPWDRQDRYGVSKLLSQLFTVELSERVSRENVVINMVDPGLTKGTGLARDAQGLMAIAVKLFFGIAGRPVDRGAATYIDALLGHGRDSHGCFLMNTKIAP